MAELAEILHRRRFEKKIAASGCSAAQLAERYTAFAVPLPVRPIAIAGFPLNPDEDVVIGTALAAHTELIVTGDHPLADRRSISQLDVWSKSRKHSHSFQRNHYLNRSSTRETRYGPCGFRTIRK